MDRIIAAYNSVQSRGHVEVEASINLPMDHFMKALDHWKGIAQPEFHTTIDFIVAAAANTPRKIRTLHFVNGVKTLDIHGTKQLVTSIMVDDPVSHKIKVSVEQPSAPFTVPRDSLVRFKTRMSFSHGNFRVDFTLVRQEKFDMCDLKAMRDQLFPRGFSGIDSSVDLAPYNRQEIEIEFIGEKFTELEFAELSAIVVTIAGGSTNVLALAAAEIVSQPERLEKFRRGELSFKQLAAQVTALSRQDYIGIFPPIGWFVTPKYDGVRAFLFNTAGKLYTIGAEITSIDSTIPDTILVDCEIIGSRAYVFDVMMCGVNVAERPFEARIDLVSAAVEKLSAVIDVSAKPMIRLTENYETELRSVWKEDKPKDKSKDGLTVNTDDINAANTAAIPLDGIIFVRPGDNYSDTRSYKWKPLSHTTIDFYALECPKTLLGIKPYTPVNGKTLYLLFVGISYNMFNSISINRLPQYRDMFPRVSQTYFPIQFSPSSNPLAYLWWDERPDLNRKIVELRLDVSADTWVFMRERTDRAGEINYWGNDFRVAELTYINYIDVFDFKDLLSPGGDGVYFNKQVDNVYKAANAYKRFVISKFIEKYASGKIMDLMCGRGADIFRYESAGVHEVLAMDIDPAAIAEMLRRKLTPRQREFHPMKKYTGSNANHIGDHTNHIGGRANHIGGRNDRPRDGPRPVVIHAQVADMRLPPAELVALAEKFGYYPGLVDFAVTNFAIHYLCDDPKHIRGFLTFVAKMLKPQGLFMFTTFDGARVFNLLSDISTNEVYNFMENDRAKYALKKLYWSDKLAATGQLISVKLPFAETMVDEPLANIEAIVTMAKKLGFAQEYVGGFAEWKTAFGQLKSELVRQLTDVDRKYIALHTIVVLKLAKKVAATK